MTARRLRPALGTTALPTLAAVLAAGCHDPQCGDSRVDELKAHGPEIQRSARAGDPGDVLHGIAVAVGIAAHTSTTVGPPRLTAGEPTPVTVLPVSPNPLPPPGVQVDAGIAPTPPVRVEPPHGDPPPPVPGGIGRVGPVPTPTPTVHHAPVVMGRRASVSPAGEPVRRSAAVPVAGRGGRGGAQ